MGAEDFLVLGREAGVGDDDVTPDGQRFVFSEFPGTKPTPLVLVTNWIAGLTVRNSRVSRSRQVTPR